MIGLPPNEIEKTRGIFLEKKGKPDFRLIRCYRVINLLNCMSKVVKKVVAKVLSQYWDDYSKLHIGQIKKLKERLASDVVAILVHIV